MSARQLLIRIFANLLFLLKKRGLQATRVKFLVFTGTVGKTTTRDAVAHGLKSLGIPVFSNKLGYSNELGILLTIFECPEFSLKNPLKWISLLKKKVPTEGFVCVELGADFYQDIKWFLKKFTPFVVFVGGVSTESWSRDVREIFKERKALLEAVPRFGFVIYNMDDVGAVELVKKSGTKAQKSGISLRRGNKEADGLLNDWSNCIFPQSLREQEKTIFTVYKQKIELRLTRAAFEPQIYGILAAFVFVKKMFPNRILELPKSFKEYQFSKDRLQIFKAASRATIIEDSYKATPFCTSWFLGMAQHLSAEKVILILTEMRPLTFDAEHFYSQLPIGFANKVYFAGPKKYFEILRKQNTNIQLLDTDNYGRIVKEILGNSSERDLILLKGSSRYRLNKLRDLLMEKD